MKFEGIRKKIKKKEFKDKRKDVNKLILKYLFYLIHN